jgi:hypothetical protein
MNKLNGKWIKTTVTAAVATAGAAGLAMVALRAPAPHAVPPAAAGAGAGVQRRWDLTLEARVDQPEQGQAGSSRSTVSGQWVATVLDVRADDYVVAYQIADPRITGQGVPGVDPAEVKALERRLAGRFYVTYQTGGAARTVAFANDVDRGARNLLQMIATETQLVRPGVASDVWTATERDGAGTYLAAYAEPAPGHITKTKLKYLEVDGAGGAAATDGVAIGIDVSDRRFTVGGDGALAAFEGHETLRLDPHAGALRLIVQTRAHLDHPRVTDARDLVAGLRAEWAALPAMPLTTHQPSPEATALQEDQALMKGTSLDEQLASIDWTGKLPATGGAAAAPADQEKVGARLAAFFRRQPGAVARAVERLGRDRVASVVTGALARAGTPPAQEALRGIARDPMMATDLRIDALTALATVKHPETQTMSAVGPLLDDGEPRLRSAALLIDGALARAGRDLHPAEAARIEADLLARLRRATEPALCREIIAALGNCASPGVVAALQGALGRPNAGVRAAAARGLRLIEDGSVDGLLQGVVRSDDDPSVRAAAIFAIGFRPLHPFVDVLARAAQGDPAEFVRSDALTMLGRDADGSAVVAGTLATVAKNDPAPGVRRLARELLERRVRVQ